MTVKAWAAAVLAFLSFALPLQPALATNDPPPAGGTVTGDWIVTDSRSYSNVPITLDRGNLTIQNGGSLTLSDVDLAMKMDTNGQSSIEVQRGGTLVLKNGCSITSSNPSLRYNFRIRAGAFATLGNSTVRHAGFTFTNGPEHNNGIYVASGNVTIDSCTMTDSLYGIYTDNANPRVSNCIFRTIGTCGIFASRGAPTLVGNTFTGASYGIYSSSSAPLITRCSFTGNTYGVYMSLSAKARVENCTFRDQSYNGILAALYSTPDIRDCTFTHNGMSDWYYGGGIRYNEFSGGLCQRNTFTSADYGSAVICYDSANPWIDVCDMDMSYRPAIYVDYRSSPRVTNSTLSTIYDAAIAVTGHATADLSRCALVSDSSLGAYAYGYGALAMANTTVRAPNSYGLYLTSSGSISARDCDIQARYYGVYSSRGKLDLLRCNLTSTESSGVLAYYGSTCSLDRCTVTANYYGVYVYYYNSYMVLRDTWVEAKNYYGAVVTEGRLDIHSSNIYATRSYALYASSNGTVNSYNSTLTTGSPSTSYIYLDTGGNSRLDFHNTLFDQFRVAFTEPTSKLDVSWYANVAVQWQNGARASNASLRIVNALNTTVFDGPVDSRGERLGLSLQEYSRTQLLWENYTKFEFTAAKNGFKKSEKRDIRSNNQTVRLTISDPDPPVVEILVPQNNLATNKSRIGFQGTAVDFASGLQKVEYSLDGGNWSPVGGLEFWNLSLDLPDGKHTIKVKATDVAGMAQEDVVTVLVDTAISLELEWPPDGALLRNGTVLVTGRAEPFSNVTALDNWTVVDSEGTFEFVLRLKDGPHEIAVTAQDEAGNSRTVVARVVVDTIAPGLSLDSPRNGTAVATPVTVFRGSTEPGARLFIGGNQYFPEPNGSFSVMVQLEEGNNSLEVRAQDAAGNIRNLTVSIRLDTVAPSLVLDKPPAGLLTNRPELELAGWTDGVAVTAGNTTAAMEGQRFSATFRLAEGMNRIEVVSTDQVGNRQSILLAVTLDTKEPYLQLLTPVAGFMTNSAALTVSGVTEPGVAVTVNGAAAQNVDGVISHAVRLVSGPNIITVKAVDAAGNPAAVNRTVTLDQYPPVLSITSPSAGSRIPGQKVMVRGITDPGSAVTVNGIAAQMDRSGRFTAEISLAEGDNSIVVTSVDQAGNPTTKMVRVTRTGALSISEKDTPLMAASLTAGILIGLAVATFVARRRGRKQVVVVAPEEPEPGKYDVPEEPPARPRPAVRVDLPPPVYARSDEAYHPPAPAEGPSTYRPPPWEGRPDYGGPDSAPESPPPVQHLPSVQAPETAPGEAPAPEGPAQGDEPVPWEEEGPQKRKVPDVDRSLDDIMRRLKS